MNKVLFAGLFLAMSCNSAQHTESSTSNNVTQPEEATREQRVSYAETITQEDLKKHLYIYASDEFEGRDTGEPGQKKAVEYIKDHYQDIDVQAAQGGDKYFQKVPLEINGIPSGSISIGDNDYTLGEGIITFSSIPNQTYDIVYAGYGIETDTYSDFKDI